MSIKDIILSKILQASKKCRNRVFVIEDFEGDITREMVANPDFSIKRAIRFALEDLLKQNRLRLVDDGYYHVPVYCRKLKDHRPADLYQVFLAVQRKFGHTEVITCDLAIAVSLGFEPIDKMASLSGPGFITFMGDGKEGIAILTKLGLSIHLKKASRDHILCSKGKSGELYQALSHLGKQRVLDDPDVKEIALSVMDADIAKELNHRTGPGRFRYKYPVWMREYLKKLVAEFRSIHE